MVLHRNPIHLHDIISSPETTATSWGARGAILNQQGAVSNYGESEASVGAWGDIHLQTVNKMKQSFPQTETEIIYIWKKILPVGCERLLLCWVGCFFVTGPGQRPLEHWGWKHSGLRSPRPGLQVAGQTGEHCFPPPQLWCSWVHSPLSESQTPLASTGWMLALEGLWERQKDSCHVVLTSQPGFNQMINLLKTRHAHKYTENGHLTSCMWHHTVDMPKLWFN